MGCVQRRDFLIAAGAFLAAPFVAKAQPTGKSYRLGFLGLSSPSDYAPYLNAFLLGLRELGYEEGRNIVIEYRWADGREERLPELANQLVRLNPDVLVAHAIGVLAVQQATSTIPIVMGTSSDPVGFGLIKSLAKPGGNTTGVTSQLIDLSSKRLELLREVVPKLKDVAVLSNLALPGLRKGLEETESAARSLGVRVDRSGSARIRPRSNRCSPPLRASGRTGLLSSPILWRAGTALASPRLRRSIDCRRWEACRQFVVDGGLLSYGASFAEGWRLAARTSTRF